jgi:hypothetical protein
MTRRLALPHTGTTSTFRYEPRAHVDLRSKRMAYDPTLIVSPSADCPATLSQRRRISVGALATRA